MDSILDDDPTLPIDFDQTSNFSRFLNQTKDSMQSDVTFPEELQIAGKTHKQRSYSINDQPPERPLSRGSTMREQESMISDLKKECFGLKMRIYFMEEKLHNAFDTPTEDILKQNIELKVTIEEVKVELRDKGDLLAKASQAMEQLTIEKENDIQKHERIREELQYKNQELKKMEQDIEKLKFTSDVKEDDGHDKIDGEVYQQLQKDVDDHQREVEVLKEKLLRKDTDYKKLKEKKKKDEESLKSMVKELEENILLKESSIETLKKDIGKLADSPERSNHHYKQLYVRQGEEIEEKEMMNHELKMELAAKTNFSEGLKDHIVAMEKTIKGLRTNLNEKELDKQRVVGQLQEKLMRFENTVQEKDDKLQEATGSLTNLKENLLKTKQKQVQLQLDSTKQKDEDVVKLGLQIHQQQHELQKLGILLDEKDKEIVFFSKKNLEAEDRLVKLNETLTIDFKKAQEASQLKQSERQDKIEALEEKCCQINEHLQQQMKYKDKVIHSIADAVLQKDTVIENLTEIAKSGDIDEENGTVKDQVIEKLQKVLREKEKYLEKYKEDQFEETKSQDNRINGLQKNLREKENALHKSEALVSSYKQKIKNLEVTSQNVALLNKKLEDSLEKSLTAERESELKAATFLHKKGEEIMKLCALSTTKDKRIETLQAYISNIYNGKNGNEIDVITSDEFSLLKEQSTEKEDEVKELRSLHDNLIRSTDLQHQQLLSLLKGKEQNIKDLYRMLTESQNDKNNVLKILNEQLSSTEQEVKDLNSSLLSLKTTQEKEMGSFHRIINEKDDVIESLVKSGQDKDRIVSNLKDSKRLMTSSTKSSEMIKLQQAFEMLKEETEQKDVEIEKFQKEMENSSEKESLVELKKQVKDFAGVVQALEDEKMELQSEFDLLKVSKESLQNQLEGAYSRLSRQGTPDYKESLMEELEELVRAAEKEKERYQTLAEKLQNNLHPESCLKLLRNEVTEVEHLRRNLQSILLSALKKAPQSMNDDKLLVENKNLKLEVKDHEKRTKSLQKQLANSEKRAIAPTQLENFRDIISDAEKQNKSLKADLKRCDSEAKQLATMKLEYEQLVRERDQEISRKTNLLDSLTKDNEDLTKQRDQCKVDLIICSRQLDTLEKRVDEQGNKNNMEHESRIQQLKEIADGNEEELKTKNIVITNLEEENKLLKGKVEQTEEDLRKLGENLQQLKDIDLQSLEFKLNATSSSAHEEKKQLKKDIKELININDRLCVKLKDLTTAYEELKADRENDKNDLYNELQKAKENINELENDVQKRTVSVCELEEQLQQVNIQAGENSDLQQKFRNARDENISLQGKVEEYMKVTELQKSIMEPELQKLRNEVLKLTKENSVLKIQKLEIDTDKEAKNELLNNLSDLKQRNQSLQGELRVQNTDNKQVHDELTRCKDLISQLEKKIADTVKIENSQLSKLQSELDDAKKEKTLVEIQLRDATESAHQMNAKLLNSTEEMNSKNKHIVQLLAKVDGLELRLDSFSPPHTSSQQNIALPSEAFTQTIADNKNTSQFTAEDNSLLTMHIKEMRELQKQLGETRRNNDALREQLEYRLSQVEQDAAKLHDPQLKITLIRDNDAMRAKLAESESSQERMKVRIDELIVEKRFDKETIEKLHQQIHELNEMSNTLKLEMEAYDRLVRQFGIQKMNGKETNSENKEKGNLDKHLLAALLEEIRDLREQLVKSIEVNTGLREKLENELGRPVSVSSLIVPMKDPTASAKRSLFSAVLQSVSIDGRKGDGSDLSNESEEKTLGVRFASPFETPTKDYDPTNKSSLSNAHEDAPPHDPRQDETISGDLCVLFGKKSNYTFIKTKSPKALSLLMSLYNKVLTCGKEHSNSLPFKLREVSDAYKHVKEILRLIATFVPQEDKQSKLTEENIRLRKDVLRLKKVLASKEHFIKSALDMVEENTLWKEHNKGDATITKKLMKARDTLKVTKGNLEQKVKRAKEKASSLDSSLTTSFEADKSSS